MQFTKSQVIALFLSASQAVTVTEVINSTCSADTLVPSTSAAVIKECSSFTACDDNTGCSGNEVCGTIIKTGDTNVSLNGEGKCVQGGVVGEAGVCGQVGKVEGVPYTISCTALGGVPDDLPVPADLLAAVEGIITENGAGTWADVQNLQVSTAFNFQDGWFIRNESGLTAGLFVETDKPKITKCTDNSGCSANECCAYWPDANNKRCISEQLGGVLQTIAPLQSWTPQCIAAAGGAPISAADDLADEKIAAAAQLLNTEGGAIDTWFTAKISTMTDEEKATETEIFNANRNASKLEAGYEALTNEQKALFETTYLTWLKAKKAACAADAKSIECIKADQLREKEEEYRKTDGYYEKDEDARLAWQTNQEENNKASKATLTAAWKEANKPADGEAGSACSKTDKCSTASHCCGTATPKVAGGEEITGVCADKVSHEFTDKLGLEYTHVCAAQKLFAAAGALLAATYLM